MNVGARILHRTTLLGALTLIVLLACSAESPKKAREPLGALPSGTTTAIPEWLPRHVFAGTSTPAVAGEARLSQVRRLTAGLDVTQTAFDRSGETLHFVATSRGAFRGALYRVKLGTSSADLEHAAERLSPESEDVTSLAAFEDRVFYRTAASGWAERVDGAPRPVDLPKAEFLTFANGEPVALGVAERGDPGAVRTVSFPMFDTRPSGRQAVASAPASWSGPFAGLAPAVSANGAFVALGLPDPACFRAELPPVARELPCDGAQSISLFSREGRGKRQVVDVAPHRVGGLAFMSGSASDEGELCFASDRDRSNFELYSVSTKNRTIERLTFAGGRAPSVSASSGRIAFGSHRAGDSADLYVANLGESSGSREVP